MFAPGVVIAPVRSRRALSATPGAKAARDYRKRQAEKIKIGRTKRRDRIRIFPLPLRDSLESVVVADSRCKPPPAGATRHEYRTAVGETAALIQREWAEKK